MERDATPPEGFSARPGSGSDHDRPADPGSVHVLFEARLTRVVLTGDIDADLGQELQEAAEEALHGGRPVEVDAQHVTFMDSTGVAFLARLASRTPEHVVTLRNPPPVVRFLIEITNITRLLNVVTSEAPAGPRLLRPSTDQQGRRGPDRPEDPDDPQPA